MKVRGASIHVRTMRKRIVIRRIHTLHGGAGPGPFGWRNRCIKTIAKLHQGEEVWHAYSVVFATASFLNRPYDLTTWIRAVEHDPTEAASS